MASDPGVKPATREELLEAKKVASDAGEVEDRPAVPDPPHFRQVPPRPSPPQRKRPDLYDP